MNIEEAKKILEKFTTEHKLFNIKHSDGLEEVIETLLTAYEKQSKEIEELKDEYNTKLLSNVGIYQLGFKDGKDSVKNKIKAKIEEVKDGTFDAKIVLQSLLEKE